DGVAALLDLVASADGLIEGFRPQVMERLGLGPDVCLERNPRLVYGRITGWGQDGPRAMEAGHDINYLAVTGALAEGASLLTSMIWAYLGKGNWREEREANLFDGGAPFYGTYRCADGSYV